MTLAAVLTVSVSLALVGGSLLLKQSAAQASILWEQQTRVSVWLQSTASSSEITSVREQLKQMPYVKGPCTYLNQQQSYARAKLLLPPTEMQYLTQQNVPTLFLCEPTIPSDLSIIQQTFTGQPGIYAVTGPYKQVRQMENAIKIVQWIFLGLALILLVSAIVLILNTIRLAIFSRRREVNVMKLVGATNWFIRIPFVSEGFFEGLFGSIFAVVMVSALFAVNPLPQAFQLPVNALIGTNIVIVLFGVIVGSLGSGLAVRRFLDV